MAKLYIGVANKAKEVKNWYIGVGDKAKKVKKAWIGVGDKAKLFYTASRVPDEYQEVEYIYRDYPWSELNTNVTPTNDINIICELMLLQNGGNSDGLVFGTIDNDNFGLIHTFSVSEQKPCICFMKKYNSSNLINNTFVNKKILINFNYYSSSINKYTNSIDETNYSFQYNDDYVPRQDVGKIYLFKSLDLDKRIYNCQIYKNGTLIRDFIPCYKKSNNIAGLYDLKNNLFFTDTNSLNSDPTKFGVGPNV